MYPRQDLRLAVSRWLSAFSALMLFLLAGCDPTTQIVYENDKPSVAALKRMGATVYELQPIGPGEFEYEVDFSNASWDPQAIDLLADLARIRKLVLSKTSFGDSDLKNLVKVGSINVLDVADTNLTAASIPTFKEIQGLSELTLVNVPVGNGGVETLSDIKTLSHLNLTGTGISDAALDKLKELPGLNILVLSDNSGITNAGIEKLKGCTKLKMLGVYKTQVTQSAIDQLKKSVPGLTMAVGAK